MMRLHQHLSGIDARNIGNTDEQMLEFVRQISLQEYEVQQKKNKASKKVVESLPEFQITQKHFKPIEDTQSGNIAQALLKKRK